MPQRLSRVSHSCERRTVWSCRACPPPTGTESSPRLLSIRRPGVSWCLSRLVPGRWTLDAGTHLRNPLSLLLQAPGPSSLSSESEVSVAYVLGIEKLSLHLALNHTASGRGPRLSPVEAHWGAVLQFQHARGAVGILPLCTGTGHCHESQAGIHLPVGVGPHNVPACSLIDTAVGPQAGGRGSGLEVSFGLDSLTWNPCVLFTF